MKPQVYKFHELLTRSVYSKFGCLDKAIGIVEQACRENDYVMMVTADHGNAEQMLDEHGKPHTAHTCNKGTRSIYF